MADTRVTYVQVHFADGSWVFLGASGFTDCCPAPGCGNAEELCKPYVEAAKKIVNLDTLSPTQKLTGLG